MIALLLMSGFRELLGSGSLLGVAVLGNSFEPWIIMILPPGGFFTLGVLMLLLAGWKERGVKRPQPRRWPNEVVPHTRSRETVAVGGDA
jgi:Na+-transporting NADH:ubiquinone oxidoreductase subunit NqrD